MLAQRLMWIAWPAFLMAGVLEMAVFALVDPGDLHWGQADLGWSRSAVYTISFFVFWMFTFASSGLTTLLAKSPFEVNRCPVSVDERPDACVKGQRCEGA